MIQSNKILNSVTLGMLSVVFLCSCSSFRYVNSASYGIYGSSVPSESSRSVSNENTIQQKSNSVETSDQKTDTYSKFFQDQGQMISEARNSNNEVFTNIDNYSSDDGNYPEEEKYYEEPIYNGNNAGWGTNPTSVSVNYINNGF